MASSYEHKNALVKQIYKHIKYIPEAFCFYTWNQLYLQSRKFYDEFLQLQKLYSRDPLLQKCVKQDSMAYGKKVTEFQKKFLLEEYLMTYLITKGQVRFFNEYVGDTYKWLLIAYPGPTSNTLAYLYQKNPFGYHNKHNLYENSFYDLEQKLLYDNMKVDIDSLES